MFGLKYYFDFRALLSIDPIANLRVRRVRCRCSNAIAFNGFLNDFAIRDEMILYSHLFLIA